MWKRSSRFRFDGVMQYSPTKRSVYQYGVDPYSCELSSTDICYAVPESKELAVSKHEHDPIELFYLDAQYSDSFFILRDITTGNCFVYKNAEDMAALAQSKADHGITEKSIVQMCVVMHESSDELKDVELKLSAPCELASMSVLVTHVLDNDIKRFYGIEFYPETEKVAINYIQYRAEFSNVFEKDRIISKFTMAIKDQSVFTKSLEAAIKTNQFIEKETFSVLRDYPSTTTLRELIFSPSAAVTKVWKENTNLIQQNLKLLVCLLRKSHFPQIDCYYADAFLNVQSKLGLLYLADNNIQKAAEHFACAGTYYHQQRSCQTDWGQRTFCSLAGAAYEKLGDYRQASIFYGRALSVYANEGDKLNCERIATLLKNEEVAKKSAEVRDQPKSRPLLQGIIATPKQTSATSLESVQVKTEEENRGLVHSF